jgi:hypothetical protein
MHRTKLLELIKRLKSKIFHVTWITKDGKLRSCNARRFVSKGINGKGKRRIAQADNSYLPIYILPTLCGNQWDFRKGWRPLNLDTVQSITCNNTTYKIHPEPIAEWVDTTKTKQKVKDNVVPLKN